MIPLALVGPAASGFSGASVLQATLTHSLNIKIKEKTGKSLTEHALDSINESIIRQTFLPLEISKDNNFIYPKRKP